MKIEIDSNYIIVLEDDVLLETVVSKIIHSIDPSVKIVWFTDGSQAIDFIIKSAELPEMILLDILLPGKIDGLRYQERIQQMNEPIPTVFMSSLSRVGFDKLMRKRNRDLPFIGKPLIENQAKRVIEICLSQSGHGMPKVA